MALVLLAFMHLYSIFNWRLVFFKCTFLCVYFFNLVLKRQTETVNTIMVSASRAPNVICLSFFFTRAIPKGQTFGLCYMCFTFVKYACCMFVFNLCKI